MTYAIGSDCIDRMDRSCVEVCPVDCIYEGSRKLYIHPDECIDCGACAVECPTRAVLRLGDGLDGDESIFAADNRNFFELTLPGRDAPLGSPGGAGAVGALQGDTDLVSGFRR